MPNRYERRLKGIQRPGAASCKYDPKTPRGIAKAMVGNRVNVSNSASTATTATTASTSTASATNIGTRNVRVTNRNAIKVIQHNYDNTLTLKGEIMTVKTELKHMMELVKKMSENDETRQKMIDELTEKNKQQESMILMNEEIIKKKDEVNKELFDDNKAIVEQLKKEETAKNGTLQDEKKTNEVLKKVNDDLLLNFNTIKEENDKLKHEIVKKNLRLEILEKKITEIESNNSSLGKNMVNDEENGEENNENAEVIKKTNINTDIDTDIKESVKNDVNAELLKVQNNEQETINEEKIDENVSSEKNS